MSEKIAAIVTLAVIFICAWLVLNHGIFMHMDQQDYRAAKMWGVHRGR